MISPVHASPKRRRARYNRDAARWVWASVADATRLRGSIDPAFHPSKNVEVFHTRNRGRAIRARRPFRVGDAICMYAGRFVREDEATPRDSSYDIDVTPGWIMKLDQEHIDSVEAPGHLCNDPDPAIDSPNVWRAKNDPECVARNNTTVNARFRRKTIEVGLCESLQVMLVCAIGPIEIGDEILVSYGREYWEQRRDLFEVVTEHES